MFFIIEDGPQGNTEILGKFPHGKAPLLAEQGQALTE